MILVTGGTGLVGSHLLAELVSSGKNVRAIYRERSKLKSVKRVFSYYFAKDKVEEYFNKIDWIKADINDIPSLEDAFADVKQVFHCAALVSFDTSKNKKLRKANIEGTANIVDFCISRKVEKLLFVSSIATLDTNRDQKKISETSFWNPAKDHSTYAITKHGAEMEVWRASQEGVPILIVNPGLIIGPGFWDSGTGLIFKKVKNGLNFYFPKITGFVGVKDVAKIMFLLSENEVRNEQFILVSENISFKHVFDKTAEILGKSAPSRRLKPWMVNLAWIFQNNFGLLLGMSRNLTNESRKSLFKTSFYSSEKIKTFLNFEFEPMDNVILETGKHFMSDHETKGLPLKQDTE